MGKRREPLEMRLESIRIHLLLRIPSSLSLSLSLSLLPFLFIASLNGEMAAGVFLLSALLCWGNMEAIRTVSFLLTFIQEWVGCGCGCSFDQSSVLLLSLSLSLLPAAFFVFGGKLL